MTPIVHKILPVAIHTIRYYQPIISGGCKSITLSNFLSEDIRGIFLLTTDQLTGSLRTKNRPVFRSLAREGQLRHQEVEKQIRPNRLRQWDSQYGQHCTYQ